MSSRVVVDDGGSNRGGGVSTTVHVSYKKIALAMFSMVSILCVCFTIVYLTNTLRSFSLLNMLFPTSLMGSMFSSSSSSSSYHPHSGTNTYTEGSMGSTLPGPKTLLREFVRHQEVTIIPYEGDSIEAMMVDGMDHFAAVTCIEADSFQEAVTSLELQLQGVPKNVRDNILPSVIIENVTASNAIQNSSKPLQANGRADAFLAWWSTMYTAPSHYETCLMLSGISFTSGEIVAEYLVEKRSVHVGDQPCYCGWFSCQTCPIYKDIETTTPIFKRHSLSLKQHEELHNYMLITATSNAKALLKDSNTIQGENDQSQKKLSSPLKEKEEEEEDHTATDSTSQEVDPQNNAWSFKINKKVF